MTAELIGCDKPVEQEMLRLRPAQSEVRALLADSSRFSADSGWRPRTELREGLARTVEWWRERLAKGAVRRSYNYMT
jgi:UDP-glucose 4-epimerase